MAIITGYVVAFLGAAIAYHLSEGKSKKRKYIIWGIALMFVISPFLSFSLGLTYAVMVGSGWAGMIMWLLFPIGFIIGLVILIGGVTMPKETDENS